MNVPPYKSEKSLSGGICSCCAEIHVGDVVYIGSAPHLSGPFCSLACLSKEDADLSSSLSRVTYSYAPVSSVSA